MMYEDDTSQVAFRDLRVLSLSFLHVILAPWLPFEFWSLAPSLICGEPFGFCRALRLRFWVVVAFPTVTVTLAFVAYQLATDHIDSFLSGSSPKLAKSTAVWFVSALVHC